MQQSVWGVIIYSAELGVINNIKLENHAVFLKLETWIATHCTWAYFLS